MDGQTPLAPGSHEVILDGIRQHYRVAGAGPLCIVHPGGPGLGGGYLDMPPLEARFTMVYLDPIGTGETSRLAEHPHGYTLDRYVRALHAFIVSLGDAVPILLGHSHGGFVAQSYALAYPERVAALILYDSAATAGAEFFAEASRNIDAFGKRYHDRPDIEPVLAAWNAVPTVSNDESFTTTLQALFPAYFADYWAQEERWAALRETIRCTYVVGGSTPFDVRDRLAAIAQPVFVIVGARDFICGPASADVLAAGLPNADRLTLDKSGHFGHLEEPGRFADGVAEFAARHDLI